MRVRLSRIFLGAVIVALGMLMVARPALQGYLERSGFKAFAEEQLADLLQADVRIGAIRVNLFGTVALSNIEVLSDEDNPSSYDVEIDRISFRYNLKQMLARQFGLPSTIVLEAPQVMLDGTRFFSALLEADASPETAAAEFRLQLANGSLAYQIPGIEKRIEFHQVNGTLVPRDTRYFQIDFSGVMEGLFDGKVAIRGIFDREGFEHDLWIELKDADAGSMLSVPLTGMFGEIFIRNQTLHFESIEARIHEQPVVLSGSFSNLGREPVLDMQIHFGGAKSPGEIHLAADFMKGWLEGKLDLADSEPHSFQSQVRRNGAVLLLEKLEVDEQHSGYAQLDFESGAYEFFVENDEQQIKGRSNLHGLHFDLNVQLNHLEFQGLDVVTSATLTLDPIESLWKSGRWIFEGGFKTDYFVIGYAPLEDFQGRFEVDASGLRDFHATWGQVFGVEGEALLKGGAPEVKLDIKVNGFDLARIKEFAAKPLPKEMKGLLKGKLTLKGDPRRPEVVGDFVVKEGRMGKLDYDRGVIHMRGVSPLFRLQDSKIYRGRSTLYLTGALDMSLQNPMAGIRIETADKLVIWKGLTMNTSSELGGLDITPDFLKLPSLRVTTEGDGNGNHLTRADELQDEQIVKLGPAINF